MCARCFGEAFGGESWVDEIAAIDARAEAGAPVEVSGITVGVARVDVVDGREMPPREGDGRGLDG